ncbi:MAG: DUF1573 domain-containing protein [Cyclobacteriaceae bacterium]
MNRIKASLLTLSVIGMMAFSCTNPETESRIAKLEGKVAELEDNGTVTPTATTPSTTPVVEEKPSGPLPEFKFSKTAHDFGNIDEGDVVEHTFTFTNAGQAPMIISNAAGSCGCTIPKWPKEPIPVGGTGEILVQFNSANKPGVQNKTVTITANTYPKISKLNIKALVAAKPKTNNPS